MGKLEVQYTREDGVVFSLKIEGVEFKAGRSDLNNGRLIHIPDMTDEEAWKQSRVEKKVMNAIMELSSDIEVFDWKSHSDDTNTDKSDENFI